MEQLGGRLELEVVVPGEVVVVPTEDEVTCKIDAADEEILEWIVVELDDCDTDMMTAVQKSYAYLTHNELATGNK